MAAEALDAPKTSSPALGAANVFRRHWRFYVMEAAGLVSFMLGAGAFTTLFLYPGSPANQALPTEFSRNAGIGVCSLPALVFIHYFGGSARTWDDVAGRLNGRFQTLQLDLAGFGDQAEAPGPYTIDAYADRVHAEIEAGVDGRYVAIGHSMGAKIALALAAPRPAGLVGLVLLAPSPPTPEPLDEMARRQLIDGWGIRESASRALDRASARDLPGDVRERLIADMLRSARPAWTAWLDGGSREAISGAVSAIAVPVTILLGDRDQIIPADIVRRDVAGRLERATFSTIAGAGHLLPVEAAAEVAAAISGHVADAAAVLQGTPE